MKEKAHSNGWLKRSLLRPWCQSKPSFALKITPLRFSPEYEKLQNDLARTLIEIILTSNDTSPLLQNLYSNDTLDLLLEQIMKEGNLYGFRAGMAVVSQLIRALGPLHDSEIAGHVCDSLHQHS